MGVVQGSGPPGDRRSCKGVFLKFLNTTEATLNALFISLFLFFFPRLCQRLKHNCFYDLNVCGFLLLFFICLLEASLIVNSSCLPVHSKWENENCWHSVKHYHTEAVSVFFFCCLFCFCFWGEYKSYFSLLFITSNNCTDHKHFGTLEQLLDSFWLLKKHLFGLFIDCFVFFF